MSDAIKVPLVLHALVVERGGAPVGNPPLEPGVHLRWALPDALTRGVVPPAGEPGEARFPDVPDVWLVVRYEPVAAPGKRAATMWVVDSWSGRVVPWSAQALKGLVPKVGVRLTAVGFVDDAGQSVAPPVPPATPRPAVDRAAFAAYYPAARDRFGFHDPLTGVRAGPVSYLVAGWYRDVRRDPINAAGDDRAREQRIADFGWCVDDDMIETTPAKSASSAKKATGTAAVTWPGSPLPIPTWRRARPDHLVCHGMVVDVPVTGTRELPADPPAPPDPRRIDFAIGDSPVDALASLIALEDDRRWLLHALAAGGVRSLQSLEGLGHVLADLHAQGFVARPPARPVECAARLATDPAWSALLGSLDDAQRAALAALPADTAGRFYKARPPLVAIAGAGRGFDHGEDGRFSEDGTLRCRVTGKSVTALDLDAYHTYHHPEGELPYPPVESAGIFTAPTTGWSLLDDAVKELILEAPLLDPTCARLASVAALGAAWATAPQPDRTRIEDGFRYHATLSWAAALPGASPADVAAASRYRGTLPSPMATWSYADRFCTMFVDYAGDLLPTDGPVAPGLVLGEVDHAVADGARFASQPLPVRGRALASAGTPRALASALRRAVADVAVAAELGDAAADELRDQADAVSDLDVLSADLAGIDDAARAAGGVMRSGLFRWSTLGLVDAYGRAVPVDVRRCRSAADAWRAAPLPPPATGPFEGVFLPPRLLDPARLRFRFLDARDPAVEAGDGASPIAGWLAVDHVDGAIEVFDAAGRSLGQLREDARGAFFDPAPGREPGTDERMRPAIADESLRRLVWGLLDAALPPAGGGPARGRVGPCQALVTLVDALRDATDRRGSTEEFLSLLMSAPIAVARAGLLLEYEPSDEKIVAAALRGIGVRVPRSVGAGVAVQAITPAPRPWPGGVRLRLGELAQLDDGALAYALDTDGGAALRATADPALRVAPGGGREVRLGDLHPWLQAGDRIEIVPGSPITLTLLLLPGAGATVTSGVLPQKRIDLRRDWTRAGLESLMPSFSFGPLLVDPATLRLPLPAIERFTWQWVRRTRPARGEAGWSVEAPSAADDRALVPPAPVTIQEGWLCVGGPVSARTSPTRGKG